MREEDRNHADEGEEIADDDEVATGFIEIAGATKDRIADEAAEDIAENSGEEDSGGEEGRFLEIELIAVNEEGWDPGEVEPEGPAVAEIDDRDGKHAAGQGEPRDWFLLLDCAKGERR